MNNSTLFIVLAAFLLIGGAIVVARNTPSETSVSNEGTRVEAPGTRVETDGDKTRIQAPGVDITVPREKSGE